MAATEVNYCFRVQKKEREREKIGIWRHRLGNFPFYFLSVVKNGHHNGAIRTPIGGYCRCCTTTTGRCCCFFFLNRRWRKNTVRSSRSIENKRVREENPLTRSPSPTRLMMERIKWRTCPIYIRWKPRGISTTNNVLIYTVYQMYNRED